ncbi:MAG: C-GCAxxG-C-C family protein [Deltaproteobacteria bacterium]|jgi:C_GCAxxG_C_C family probable redox protein|nr:C-GCAxxG-C-C family protein [Deltaproteobacteria bacterium]
MITEQEVAAGFKQGFDCGQIVLASVSAKFGLDSQTAHKLAAGFGGGMGRGQTCGAVVGAIIALGLKYGHYEADTPNQKSQIMGKAVEFQQRFMEIYPSVVCRELLGYDLSCPEQMEIIMDKNLLFTFCPKVVADAVQLLEDVL